MRAREFVSETADAKSVLDYIHQTHHEPLTPKLQKAVLAHPSWRLTQVPLSSLHIPDQEYDDEEQEPESDPYNRVQVIDPEHAGEYSANFVDRRPIVVDDQGWIIDGNHRAWAAAELLNRDRIQAWVPSGKLDEGFKNRLAQAALAGSMALGAGGANAMDWKDAAMTGAMFVPGIGQVAKAYNVGKSLYQAGTAAKQYKDAGNDLKALAAQEKARPKQSSTAAYDPDHKTELEPVDENFADGRNPQDKGDSKRYGVPTKASVSTLRKVAKQGGRKGQLAHWMANMKAGRAKAKKK